jgi:hypothetical protein
MLSQRCKLREPFYYIFSSRRRYFHFQDLIVCFVTPPSNDLLCQLELDNDLLDKRRSKGEEPMLFFQRMNHINKPNDCNKYVSIKSFEASDVI